MVLVRDDVMERVYHNKDNAKVPFPMLMDWTQNKEAGNNFYVNTPTMLTIQLT